MKTILILANSSAGLYKFRHELLVELTKEYIVYASLPDHSFDEELAKDKVNIIDTPINRRGVNPIEDIKLLKNYLVLLKRLKPSVVLTYTIKPNVYGGMACRIMRVPYLANITGLGSALENPGKLQKITLMLYRIGLKKANIVFTQNSYNKEFLEQHNVIKSKIVLLPGSGVNTSRFRVLPWPSNGRGFAFVSRVMKEKGIEEYIACAESITKEYPGAVFHVMGDCEEDYEQRLHELNRDGVIRYHGKVKDVIPYLSDVKCLIHPSFHEGMSNVCLEAASCGRAVITTDRPGCKETVVDGETGFIVPVKDKEALITAVRRFLDMPDEEQRTMANNGRRYIEENFDRQIVVDEYISAITGIIAKTE